MQPSDVTLSEINRKMLALEEQATIKLSSDSSKI